MGERRSDGFGRTLVVMEVLLVVRGRKIGYRGPHAHVHRRRPGSIACTPVRSRGLGRLVGLVHLRDVFLFLPQSADF